MAEITWKRKLKYTIIQAVILGCWAWSMRHGDKNYAYNLYAFWIVFEFILTFFILLSKECQEVVEEGGYTFGPVVYHTINGIQVVGLALVGWYWLTGYKLWSSLVFTHTRDLAKQNKEKKAELEDSI